MNKPIVSKLSDKHQQEIFITRQFLKLGDYDRITNFINANCRTITTNEAKEMHFDTKSSGILFTGDNQQLHFKPDKPKVNKNGKPIKYITASGDTDYDAWLPVNPDYLPYWEDIDKLIEYCYKINNKPYLIITEGEFKSLALNIIGLPCIALLGVELGLTSSKNDIQGKRFLVPTLEYYASKGFNFLFAFDSDIATNNNVLIALNKLAYQLSKFGCEISMLPSWDSSLGKGVDDYIVNNGVEMFKNELLHKSIKWGSDIIDITIDDTKKKQKSIDDYSKEIADKYKSSLKYCRTFGSWFYYESEVKGMWSIIDEIQVKTLIRNYEKSIDHPKIVNAIYEFLRQDLYTKDWLERTDLLPFKDCVVEVKTGKILKHDSGYQLTWQLPRHYLDKIDNHATISNWLIESTANKEHRDILECFLAATLRQMTHLQKALHLIGPGGSGKSTFMDLATNLIGKENTVSTSFELIGKPVYRVNLLDKRLINFADQPCKIQNVDIFKSITGQDTLSGDKKFKDPIEFKTAGLCLITSNDPLFFGNSAGWLTRRMITIPFVNVPKKKRNLALEFAGELASYTQYLLSIPVETIEKTLLGYTLNSTFIESQIRTDPLMAWLNNCVVFDKDYRQLIGNDKNADKDSFLFSNYHQYCNQTNRMGSLTHRNFSEKLLECCQILGKPVEKKKSNNGVSITGLMLRTESHFDIPTIEEALLDNENSLNAKSDGLSITSDGLSDGSNSDVSKLVMDVMDNNHIHAHGKNNGEIDLEIDTEKTNISEIIHHIHHKPSDSNDLSITQSITCDGTNHHFLNNDDLVLNNTNENETSLNATNDYLKTDSKLTETNKLISLKIGDKVLTSDKFAGIVVDILEDNRYGIDFEVSGNVRWASYDISELVLVPTQSKKQYLDVNGKEIGLSDTVVISRNPNQRYVVTELLPNGVVKIRASHVAILGKGQTTHDIQEVKSNWVKIISKAGHF